MLFRFSAMKDQTVWHISLTSYRHLSSLVYIDHRMSALHINTCIWLCQYGVCSFTSSDTLTEVFAWVCYRLIVFFVFLSHSPTGSHVEWCKQLIAATISSQISGGVPPEAIPRECKVRGCFLLSIILSRTGVFKLGSPRGPQGSARGKTV